jgi:hypothetical protein
MPNFMVAKALMSSRGFMAFASSFAVEAGDVLGIWAWAWQSRLKRSGVIRV